MPTWPAGLPQCPILNAFSEQRQRNVAAFQPDVGPPKMRRRSTAVATLTSVVYRMTTSDLSIFNTFYEDTLADGTLPFEWEHPVTNLTYSWIFDSRDAPKIDRITPNTFRVSFNLLRLPGAGTATVIPPEPDLENRVLPLTFSPPAGTYRDLPFLTIWTATFGATIYYTTDGSDPTEASTLYAGPIAVPSTAVIKARGYKVGKNLSLIATAGFIINASAPFANAETDTYKANIIAAGSTISDAQLSAVDVFITKGKAFGWFAKLVDCGLFLGNNITAALVKLVKASGASQSYTNHGSPPTSTYSSTLGLTFNSANAQYLGSGCVPASEGIDADNLTFVAGALTVVGGVDSTGLLLGLQRTNDSDPVFSIGPRNIGMRFISTPVDLTTGYGMWYCNAASGYDSGDGHTGWTAAADGIGVVNYLVDTRAWDVTYATEYQIGREWNGGYQYLNTAIVGFAAVGSAMSMEELKSLTAAVRLLHSHARAYDFGITDLAVGDSITLGQATSNDWNNGWAKQLNDATGDNLVNVSVSGSSCIVDQSTALAGKDRMTGIGAFSVRYVYIMLGTNDLVGDVSSAGDPIILAACREGLSGLAEAVMAVGAVPILTFPWMYSKPSAVNYAWEQMVIDAANDVPGSIGIRLISAQINTGNPGQFFAVGGLDVHMIDLGHEFLASLVAATLDGTYPVLSNGTAAVTSSSTINFSVDTTGTSGNLYLVVTESPVAPLGYRIVAGLDENGSAAVYAHNAAVSVAGTKTFNATGLGAANRLFYGYWAHDISGVTAFGTLTGFMSLVADSGDGLATNATTPVLSSPTATAVTGGDKLTASVSTTVDVGILYMVVTTNVTAPTKAQVKAGQDHTGSAAPWSWQQVVSATGVNAIGRIEDLTPSTNYYCHFMHEGLLGLQSNVATSSLVTTTAYSYIGPGDLVAGAHSWFGLRAYSAATAGNIAVRIIRASDNAEQDFNTLTTGQIDLASITTFLSGTTGKVRKLYDQTGNGHDIDDSNSGGPPGAPVFTFNVLNNNPALTFGPSMTALNCGVNLGTQPYSMSAVMRLNTNTSGVNENMLSSYGPSVGRDGVQRAFMYAGVTAFIDLNETDIHSCNFVFNGASSLSVIDAGASTINAGTGASGAWLTIGAVFNNNPGKGVVFEAGFWQSALSSPQALNIDANQTSYWNLWDQ